MVAAAVLVAASKNQATGHRQQATEKATAKSYPPLINTDNR